MSSFSLNLHIVKIKESGEYHFTNLVDGIMILELEVTLWLESKDRYINDFFSDKILEILSKIESDNIKYFVKDNYENNNLEHKFTKSKIILNYDGDKYLFSGLYIKPWSEPKKIMFTIEYVYRSNNLKFFGYFKESNIQKLFDDIDITNNDILLHAIYNRITKPIAKHILENKEYPYLRESIEYSNKIIFPIDYLKENHRNIKCKYDMFCSSILEYFKNNKDTRKFYYFCEKTENSELLTYINIDIKTVINHFPGNNNMLQYISMNINLSKHSKNYKEFYEICGKEFSNVKGFKDIFCLAIKN